MGGKEFLCKKLVFIVDNYVAGILSTVDFLTRLGYVICILSVLENILRSTQSSVPRA